MASSTRRAVAVLVFAGVAAAMVVPRVVSGQEGDAGCGGPGQAPCPLQGWMRSRMAAPLAARGFADLEASFSALERAAPDAAWTIWGEAARAGVRAAKAADSKAVREACKACHDAHRADYRAKYRGVPAPR